MAGGQKVNAIEAIAAAAALVIIARLITFRRRGRYRPGIALGAWLLVVAATCVLFFGLPPLPAARAIITAALVMLAAELMINGGNVAHLVRRHRG